MFDQAGWRIPPPGLKVQPPNPEHRLGREGFISFPPRLACLEKVGFPLFNPSAFAVRVGQLNEKLEADDRISGLLNGACLPVVIPRIEVSDYGQSADELITKAGEAYCLEFPGRTFRNLRQGDLTGEVTITPQSRHEQLIERIALSPVVGILFPCALLGYSVRDQREQMSGLPKGFLLSGVIDMAVAWLMYVGILGRSHKTPFRHCSANSYAERHSLGFMVDDDRADFGMVQELSRGDGAYSGGLLYIG